MRRCHNCVFYPSKGNALAVVAERKPCGYPLPAYLATFLTQEKHMLPTDGQGCAVHRLEGEETKA